jgi:hypothetical protein
MLLEFQEQRIKNSAGEILKNKNGQEFSKLIKDLDLWIIG